MKHINTLLLAVVCALPALAGEALTPPSFAAPAPTDPPCNSTTSFPGVSGIDANRTNIGVSNPHDTEVGFWVELFDTSGLSRGSFRTAVAPSYR